MHNNTQSYARIIGVTAALWSLYISTLTSAQAVMSSGRHSSRDDVQQNLTSLREFFAKPHEAVSASIGPSDLMKSVVSAGHGAVPPLLAILEDETETQVFRVYVARMLAAIRDETCIPSLAALASDRSESDRVRAAAVVALVAFDRNAQAKRVLTTLANESQLPRIVAVCRDVSSAVETRTQIASLAESVRSADYNRRLPATISLADVAAETSGLARELAWAELQTSGYEVIFELLTLAQETNTETAHLELSSDQNRWMSSVVHGLARAKGSDTVTVLSDIYALSPDYRLRQDCLSVLAAFTHDPEAQRTLLTGLRDPVPKLRMVASRSLLILTEGKAVPIIRRALESEDDPSVRKDMSRALGYYSEQPYWSPTSDSDTPVPK